MGTSRSRSRTDPNVEVVLQRKKPLITSAWYNDGTRMARTYYESITDVVTDNFRARIAAGEIINNPMESLKILGVFEPYDYSAIWGTGESAYKGNTWVTAQPSFDDFVEAVVQPRSLAITAARAGVHSPEFALLVFVGEFGEALRMVRNAARSLQQFKRRALKNAAGYSGLYKPGKRKRRRKNAPETSSDRWLEFRYGWSQLVYDFQDAVDALAKAQKTALRRTSRGYGTYTNSTSDSTSVDNGTTVTNVTTDTSYTVNCRAGELYSVNLDGISRLSAAFGLTEIPRALWDLGTLTFLGDWLGNVGTWISSVTPKAGTNSLASYVTIEETLIRSSSRTITKSPSWGGDSIIVTPHVSTWTLKRKRREINPGSTWPVLYNVPKDDIKRTLDLIALARQGLQRRRG